MDHMNYLPADEVQEYLLFMISYIPEDKIIRFIRDAEKNHQHKKEFGEWLIEKYKLQWRVDLTQYENKEMSE